MHGYACTCIHTPKGQIAIFEPQSTRQQAGRSDNGHSINLFLASKLDSIVLDTGIFTTKYPVGGISLLCHRLDGKLSG